LSEQIKGNVAGPSIPNEQNVLPSKQRVSRLKTPRPYQARPQNGLYPRLLRHQERCRDFFGLAGVFSGKLALSKSSKRPPIAANRHIDHSTPDIKFATIGHISRRRRSAIDYIQLFWKDLLDVVNK